MQTSGRGWAPIKLYSQTQAAGQDLACRLTPVLLGGSQLGAVFPQKCLATLLAVVIGGWVLLTLVPGLLLKPYSAQDSPATEEDLASRVRSGH